MSGLRISIPKISPKSASSQREQLSLGDEIKPLGSLSLSPSSLESLDERLDRAKITAREHAEESLGLEAYEEIIANNDKLSSPKPLITIKRTPLIRVIPSDNDDISPLSLVETDTPKKSKIKTKKYKLKGHQKRRVSKKKRKQKLEYGA